VKYKVQLLIVHMGWQAGPVPSVAPTASAWQQVLQYISLNMSRVLCVCCSGAVAPVAGASQMFAQHQAMPGGVQTYIAACLQGPHARWVIGISRLCDLLGEHADTLS
jgi:hypothetical protein